MLVTESSPWNNNDFAIPYLSYFHPSRDDVFQWQNRIKRLKRRILFSFAGARRPNLHESIRNEIIDQCLATRRKCRFLECEKRHKCHKPVYLMKLFQSSVFCLQPPGDSYTRRSIFDSILAGCIPVFFHPCSAYVQYIWPFTNDYAKYSVLIPANDVKSGNANIERILQRIPREKTSYEGGDYKADSKGWQVQGKVTERNYYIIHMFASKRLIVDDMFDRVELKLRCYGSKSVVKYPRYSIRLHSIYADAEGRKIHLKFLALASIWILIFACGCTLCLVPIVYTISLAYQDPSSSDISYGSQASNFEFLATVNGILFMAIGSVIGYPLASAAAISLKNREKMGIWLYVCCLLKR